MWRRRRTHDCLQEILLHQKRVLELYAGVGIIGMFLAPLAKKITLVESSDHARDCFIKSCRLLPESPQKKMEFFHARSEEMGAFFQENDVLIVDPPRKGLSREIKPLIFSSSIQQMIYISCGWESFQRDALEFLEHGWKLETARGFLLFPGTNHIEIIGNFLRE